MAGESGAAAEAAAAGKRGRKTLRVGDLHPDEENRRRRTPRGSAMLISSLRDVGAARSIVIDENDQVLAGNGVLDAAKAVGIDKVQVVETDGQTLIAVRRTGLSAEDRRQLAMYDNRTGELAEWEPEQIASDVAAGSELQPFFTEHELRALLKRAQPQNLTVEEVESSEVLDRFWISVRGPLKVQAFALKRLTELLADLEGVTVELGTVQTDQLVAL